MPKTRSKKNDEVKKLANSFTRAPSAVFVGFSGFTVNKTNQFRGKCYDADITYVVSKKTLIGIAAKEAKIDINIGNFEGQVGVVFGSSDEIAPAKLVYEFGKTEPAIKILGGLLEGKVLDASDMIALAKLPSKEELLAKLVSSIYAPVGGFVNVLSGSMRSLVQVINQIAQTK